MTLSRSPVFLPWHWRLEARVLLSIPIIAGFALGAVLASTIGVVNNYSLDRARDDLVAAHGAVERLVDARAESAARQVRLIADMPPFRQAVEGSAAESGAQAIANLTESFCRKIAASFCVVTDSRGRWQAQSNAPRERASRQSVTALIDTARGGRAARGIVALADGPAIVVAEPVKSATDVVGSLTAAYRLDDAVAGELSKLTGGEVAFICADRMLCGSSLSESRRIALAALLERARQSPPVDAPPGHWDLAGTTFVAGVYGLSADALRTGGSDKPASAQRAARATDSHTRLVLLQDWSSAERVLMQIRTALTWVGIWTVGVAVGGTILLSRRLTRPLRDLASAAHEIAGGNWARRVPVDGPAEARTMAEAFNHMTVTLSHWHEEATSQAARLRESNDRFRSVTDSAHDAIVSVNSRGEIVFWNLRAQAVFGYDEQEAAGQQLTQLISQSDRTRHADQIQRLWTSDSPWMGRTVEIRITSREGREVPVELSLSTWKAGNEDFYTVLIRDITERKQTAEALRQREDELRHAQKMEAVGRLAGGIAHDFNNLLTGILGYADLILEGLPPDTRLRNDVEGIRKAGRSAAALTRELLAFSRKQVLQPDVLDLNEVVRGTEGLIRRLIGADTHLVLQLDDSAKPVKADRSQIEQVLLNLAANARDAMPDGGQLTIKTGNSPDGQPLWSGQDVPIAGPHVILAMTDTGHGMTSEVRSHIFEPFFTTKEMGKGTGLGLATVYGIVTQSGGHILVDSEPGKGSTLTVCLPAVHAAVARVDRGAEAGDRALHGSETVLLVEDNASVRDLARETLTRYGYRVLEAPDGQQALRIAKANLQSLSLVVTDVVMPVMGGRELASRLKTLRKSLKVLFTSGYTTGTVRQDIPPELFLQKPFTPAMLGKKVREVLDAQPHAAQFQGTRS
ncbi:MAG TPA: PAS domain S-box protein [Vicinamibacterales bacterium]|nr:PAS domain S-box protein [Vicinamibacterales bacterium]